MDNEKDIYIKLIEDITGINDIKPKTPILQSQVVAETVTSQEKYLDDALKKTCTILCEKLGGTDMTVGSAEGYTEPCPIQYTGNILHGDRFDNVFLGLNPFCEPPRAFPTGTTFADLANFHHPDDIRYGCLRERYLSDKDAVIKNNYWRVLGNKEGDKSWSPYYQPIIRTHIALLPKNSKFYHIYNLWGDLLKVTKNNKSKLTQYLLTLLRQHPIANAEMIPFKTRDYSMDNFTNLLDLDEDIATKYRKYISTLFDFINKYASPSAYIVIPTNLTKDADNMTKVYNTVKKQISELGGICEGGYFVYSKHITDGQDRLRPAIPPERKQNELTPLYLANWTSEGVNRKIVITPSVSGRGQYNWIYNFSNGWIEAIRKYFDDQAQ